MDEAPQAAARIGLDQPQQVENDEKVQGYEAHAEGSYPADELEELPWKKGSSHKEGDVLGPDLFQDKSDPLREIDGGVEEDAEAEHSEIVRTDEGGLGEEEIDGVAVGVEAQAEDDPMVEEADQVTVNEVDGADAHEHEEEALQELEDSDDDDPSVAMGLESSSPVRVPDVRSDARVLRRTWHKSGFCTA